MGVSTGFTDGLGTVRGVSDATLERVCRALGAALDGPGGVVTALEHALDNAIDLTPPPVVVAWNGNLALPGTGPGTASTLHLESGGVVEMGTPGRIPGIDGSIPLGYHTLHTVVNGVPHSSTVISAPMHSWRRADSRPAWGVGAHLAALRSARSRAVGDLRDLATTCRWVAANGGNTLTVLPLLPTFNTGDVEPSPYSPVSRLFWSELMLDLGDAHAATGAVDRLDVASAHEEILRALALLPLPDLSTADDELRQYARFRGAQARLGRDWRR